MDWRDLGGQLAKLGAPVIGTALGGPLGGMIGGALGNIVATALGTDATPEAVNDVINNQPADVVQSKLAAADSIAEKKMDSIVALAQAEADVSKTNITEVNKTIQAEDANPQIEWYHWRHLVGYVVVLWFVVPLPAFVRLMFQYDANAVGQLTALITAAVPIYGFMSGLLGYVAYDTTKFKTTLTTGEHPPSLLGGVIDGLKGKRK